MISIRVPLVVFMTNETGEGRRRTGIMACHAARIVVAAQREIVIERRRHPRRHGVAGGTVVREAERCMIRCALEVGIMTGVAIL